MIQSVERAIQILELFNDNDSLSLTEIAQLMNLPKTTVYGLISTLEAHQYVYQDELTARYTLGCSVLALGGLFSKRLDVRRVSLPFMKKLAQETNQTIQLSMLRDLDVIYLECVEPEAAILLRIRVGNTAPANCTATGKVLLAYMEEKKLLQLLANNKLKGRTKYSITDPDRLMEEFAKIRKKGYAEDHFESDEQVMGYAMPVFDYRGRAIAGISVGGLVNFFSEEKGEEYRRLLRRAATEISESMGYRPGAMI